MLSLGLPASQSTASLGPAGTRRDCWLVPVGPFVAVDLTARAQWHGDRLMCSATGGSTSMKIAYTSEVASRCRVAPRTQGSVFFLAFPCVPAAARAPAITSAFMAGRRRKELCCSGVPFYQKRAALQGPPHRLNLFL